MVLIYSDFGNGAKGSLLLIIRSYESIFITIRFNISKNFAPHNHRASTFRKISHHTIITHSNLSVRVTTPQYRD